MKSIQLQCALFPLKSQLKQRKKQLKTPKEPLTWFTSNSEALKLSNSQRNRCRLLQARTEAIHTGDHGLVLALASPPARSPEEIWAFVGTSVLLFFMFWVSNFVAPELISKYYEFDKVKDNEKGNDEDDDDEDYES